jgi:lysophospholipase L1-like esterase
VHRVVSLPVMILVLVLVLVVVGCGSSAKSGAQRTTSTAKTSPSAVSSLKLVGLGDSISTANACDGCTDLVAGYANRASKSLGRPVEANNLSIPGADIAALLKQVQGSEPAAALKGADIVVLDIGFNDTPWNRIDDPCRAAPNYPVIHWKKIGATCIKKVTAEYTRALDTLIARIAALRAGRPTVLRVVSVYDNVIGNTGDPGWSALEAVHPSIAGNSAYQAAQCAEAVKHHGECVDMLHAINGPDVTKDAAPYLSEHTHMNQRGHDLAAEKLDELGYAPVVL